MAFEVNALDCLLKPIAPERLAAALERLRPVRGLPPR
jgi:DNA-binding LytR/AlgR family response regulator